MHVSLSDDDDTKGTKAGDGRIILLGRLRVDPASTRSIVSHESLHVGFVLDDQRHTIQNLYSQIAVM